MILGVFVAQQAGVRCLLPPKMQIYIMWEGVVGRFPYRFDCTALTHMVVVMGSGEADCVILSG